jgi:hypothetical protein
MYKPNINNSKTLEELTRYVDDELKRISDSFLLGEIDTSEFKIWYEEPPRPVEGVQAFLDNSISGITTTGLHEYVGGVWVKL